MELNQQELINSSPQMSNNNNTNSVSRMKAHEYESKIQELLEKIEVLESRLRLAGEQKVKVVTQLKNFEDENELLKDQISRQNVTNKKLNIDKANFEKQIQELKQIVQEIQEKNE